MKKLLFAIITTLIVTVGSATQAANGDDKEVKIKTSAVCEMCKERLERNLAFEKGVKSSNLDLTTKVMTITYNSKKTDVNKIKAVISKTGYDADEVKADEKGYNKLPACCKKGGMSRMHQ